MDNGGGWGLHWVCAKGIDGGSVWAHGTQMGSGYRGKPPAGTLQGPIVPGFQVLPRSQRHGRPPGKRVWTGNEDLFEIPFFNSHSPPLIMPRWKTALKTSCGQSYNDNTQKTHLRPWLSIPWRTRKSHSAFKGSLDPQGLQVGLGGVLLCQPTCSK